MGTKRHQDGSDEYLSDQPEEKRAHVLPSLATIIRKTIKDNTLQDLIIALEPLFRKVLKEELERVLPSILIQRPPQTQIQQIEAPSLQLIFKKPLSQPIFTGIKLEAEEGNPLQVMLVDALSGRENTPISLPSPLKLQVVVLNGDFPPEGRDDWTKEEFDKSVVKEREGRRPLIIGEVNLAPKEGCCTIGELVFTDNSSWIRSRHFRIGVTVIAGGPDGLRIKEAMTERFVVKDHRGEAYKKHYPPSLDDEVWRLEKIAKDGKFHKRLESEGIFSVEDFLKLHSVDPAYLRKIIRMSDHMWEATVSHARTCILDEKVYLYRGSQCNLLLSPICELLGIETDNGRLSLQDLNTAEKDIVNQMVREAYKHWDIVEEVGKEFWNVVCKCFCSPCCLKQAKGGALYLPSLVYVYYLISCYLFVVKNFNGRI